MVCRPLHGFPGSGLVEGMSSGLGPSSNCCHILRVVLTGGTVEEETDSCLQQQLCLGCDTSGASAASTLAERSFRGLTLTKRDLAVDMRDDEAFICWEKPRVKTLRAARIVVRGKRICEEV